MIHATRSSTPILLVHLPGGQYSTEPEPDEGTGETAVEGAIWNTALGGPSGGLGGEMELRREILDRSGRDEVTGDARVFSRIGLWFNEKRFNGMS
jgi:hypothetical protein